MTSWAQARDFDCLSRAYFIVRLLESSLIHMTTPPYSLRWTNRSFRQPLLLCGGMLIVGNLLYGLVSEVGQHFFTHSTTLLQFYVH